MKVPKNAKHGKCVQCGKRRQFFGKIAKCTEIKENGEMCYGKIEEL